MPSLPSQAAHRPAGRVSETKSATTQQLSALHSTTLCDQVGKEFLPSLFAQPILQEGPMNQRNLLDVDWSKIPAPTDDGAAAHLVGMTVPPISMVATDDTSVTLSALPGRTVVFAYPRTGEL